MATFCHSAAVVWARATLACRATIPLFTLSACLHCLPHLQENSSLPRAGCGLLGRRLRTSLLLVLPCGCLSALFDVSPYDTSRLYVSSHAVFLSPTFWAAHPPRCRRAAAELRCHRNSIVCQRISGWWYSGLLVAVLLRFITAFGGGRLCGFSSGVVLCSAYLAFKLCHSTPAPWNVLAGVPPVPRSYTGWRRCVARCYAIPWRVCETVVSWASGMRRWPATARPAGRTRT
jgi:hypothetical protein